MAVIIRVGTGIVSNDLVDPPKPLLFKLVETHNYPRKHFKNFDKTYYLQGTDIEDSPWLSYQPTDHKFVFVPTPHNLVVISLNPLPLHQIYESVELEDKEGSLGKWYIYAELDPAEPNNKKTLSTRYPLLLIMLTFIIVLIIILARR